MQTNNILQFKYTISRIRFAILITFLMSMSLFLIEPFYRALSIEISKYIMILGLGLGFIHFKESYNNWVNPHNLFLFMIMFFLMPRVFLDIFNYEPIQKTSFYTSYTYSDKTVFKILTNMNIALFSFILGSGKINSKLELSQGIDYNQIKKLGKIFFFIGLPFIIFKTYESFRLLTNYGYRGITTGLVVSPDSFLLTILSNFCFLGFFIIVASNSTNKNRLFIILSTIILFVSLMADGRRGPGFCFLFVIIWFNFYIKNKKPNFSKLAIFALVGLSLAIFIGFFRNIKSVDKGSFDYIFFIYSQGVSIQVLGYTIQSSALIDYNFIDLFGNIFRYIDLNILGHNPPNQYVIRATDYKVFSYYISYLVNKDLYMSGLGIGGSYLAQLYAIGGEIAQLIGGLIIGFLFTTWINFSLKKGFWGHLIVLLFLPHIIYIPRDNMFDFVTDTLLFSILLALVYFILKFYRQLEELKKA